MTEPKIPTFADYQNWAFEGVMVQHGEEVIGIIDVIMSREHPGYVCCQAQFSNGMIMTLCKEIDDEKQP